MFARTCIPYLSLATGSFSRTTGPRISVKNSLFVKVEKINTPFKGVLSRNFTGFRAIKSELERHGYDIKSWTKAEYEEQLKVYDLVKLPQLKAELEAMGLSVEGTKTQLVIRYIEGKKSDSDLKKEAQRLGVSSKGTRQQVISRIEEAHKVGNKISASAQETKKNIKSEIEEAGKDKKQTLETKKPRKPKPRLILEDLMLEAPESDEKDK